MRAADGTTRGRTTRGRSADGPSAHRRSTRPRALVGAVSATVIAGAVVFASGPAWAASSTAPGATTTSSPTATTPADGGGVTATVAPDGTATATPQGAPETQAAQEAAQAAAPSAAGSADVLAAAGAAPDPSLARMDATGNHTMGASIAAHAEQSRAAAGGTTTQAAPRSTTAASGPPPGKVQGMDVSAWQPNVDFVAARAAGARFAYIKATEGVTYQSATYRQQYIDAKHAGIVRGGYVYAQPRAATGAQTARYFFQSGGGWSPDGYTLPPLLDIEYGSASQGTCYGLSWGAMRTWIKDFSATVHATTGRYPVIYTTTDWWKQCTNNSVQFSRNSLFVAIYPVHDFTSPGELGRSWSRWRFWQWAAAGTFPGDQDVYWSTVTNLKAFAKKTSG